MLARLLRGVGGVLVFLLVWQIAIALVFQFDYLPPPSSVLAALTDLGATGDFYAECLHTLTALLVGWAISAVFGVLGGIVLGLSPTARKYSLATIEILRPLPGIAFVPV